MPVKDEKSLDGRIHRDALIALATPSGLKRKDWMVTTFENSPPVSPSFQNLPIQIDILIMGPGPHRDG